MERRLFQIGGLETRYTTHLGPISELNLPAFAPDQALPFHVGEDPVDVDRGLAGDVGDLLLREGIVQMPVGDMHPLSSLAQQMRNTSGRIAATAIDQPLVTDRLIALKQAPE